MCVALHWSLFPLLTFILFCATLLLLTSIALIIYFVVRDQSESPRTIRSPKTSRAKHFWSSPLSWTKDMLCRAPIYTAIRRQFSNASNIIRWRNSTEAKFDHDQILHNARWQAFWRERILPANNEFLRKDIPLDAFPVVRQSQLGLLIAYSSDFIKDIFARKEEIDSQAAISPTKQYVLILRSPRAEQNDEIEPAFKEVVTDMLQFKQVCIKTKSEFN